MLSNKQKNQFRKKCNDFTLFDIHLTKHSKESFIKLAQDK